MTLIKAASAFSIFFQNNWGVILFYLFVVLIIYSYRRKFDVHLGFIALFRTKWGLKSMDKYAKKYPKLLRFIGDLGIVVGFSGMVLMFWFLADGVYKFFLNPKADAVVAVVIPGLNIAGSPLNGLSLGMGLLIIFLVASFHEFGHGVISRLYNIKVRASGIVFFGPILGAFVEPDQKDLAKVSDNAKLAMYSAGPFFNVIMTLFVLLLISSMSFFGMTWTAYQPAYIGEVVPNSTLYYAGIEKGETITAINNNKIENIDSLIHELNDISVNDTIFIETDKGIKETNVLSRPSMPDVPFLGIEFTRTNFISKLLHKIFTFLMYLAMISLGIGTANLLPFGPLDGGRMLHNRLFHWFGKKNESAALKCFSIISSIVLLMLLVTIFGPLFGLFM